MEIPISLWCMLISQNLDQVCRPVYALIFHQKWISSVRMQSIYKMHSPLERPILALSVAYLKS